VTLCRPLWYSLHVTPLERRRRNPQKRDVGPPRACAGRRRDVGLVGRVSSAISGPVWLSLPLHYHPKHCCTIPGVVVSPERQDIATIATVRPPTLRQPNPRAGVRTMTKQEVSTVPPSKSPLDGHRTRRDAPPGARFARTIHSSMALHTIPPYVARTVRHDYKPPPLAL
jgi:hypothetical protein